MFLAIARLVLAVIERRRSPKTIRRRLLKSKRRAPAVETLQGSRLT